MLTWLKALPLLAQLALGTGAILGAGGVAAGAYAFIWHEGYAAAAAECDEAALRARVAELEFDLELAHRAADNAQKLTDVLQDRVDTLDDRLGDFDAGDYCRDLDDAGADGLRHLLE